MKNLPELLDTIMTPDLAGRLAHKYVCLRLEKEGRRGWSGEDYNLAIATYLLLCEHCREEAVA